MCPGRTGADTVHHGKEMKSFHAALGQRVCRDSQYCGKQPR